MNIQNCNQNKCKGVILPRRGNSRARRWVNRRWANAVAKGGDKIEGFDLKIIIFDDLNK